MILSEEMINDIKYYSVNHHYCKPLTYNNIISNPNDNYDEVVIVFKQWWRFRLRLRFTKLVVFYRGDKAEERLKLVDNEEYLELANQLKVHVAADNGYSVDEPKVKVNE